MNYIDNHYYLQVQQVEKTCLFQLTWGSNQKVTASIAYPDAIEKSFRAWQQAYENFYRSKLRGKVLNAGTIEPTVLDWQGRLVHAEAQLLYEFHQWLRSRELYEIRAIISRKAATPTYTNVFISCSSAQLMHLPWEAWEISTEFTGAKKSIVRQPLNIHTSVTSLASLVDKLSTYNPKLINFDYLFDRATNNEDDLKLANSIENAIAKNGTWFIFGTILDSNSQKELIYNKVANLNQSLKGYVDGYPGRLALLDENTDCTTDCPFTYLIALTQLLNQEKSISKAPQPKVSNNSDLRTSLVTYLNSIQVNSALTQLNKLRLHPLTTASGYLGQTWLYPIVDYSIPPEQVYEVVSASDLLKNNIDKQRLQRQVIIIGTGGYDEAGLTANHSDTFPLPLGVAYWRLQNLNNDLIENITGVELNAYMVQHLLKQHIITPIPDLWMIGIAAFLGKAIQIILNKQQYKKRGNILLLASLVTVIAAYLLLSMQMYISASIMAPIFLPSIAFCIYVKPSLKSKNEK